MAPIDPLAPDPGAPWDLAAQADLTRAILARTSGDPCRRLQVLACDLVDGLLAPLPAELAATHLDHCPACRNLIAALGTLRTVLPTLASLDPGPGFTQAVVQATAHRAPRLTISPPSFHATWTRLMRRPRICFEAAYLGTAAGILALNVPASTLRQLADPSHLTALAHPRAAVAPVVQAAKVQALAFETGQRQAVHAAAEKGGQAVANRVARVKAFGRRLLAVLKGWGERLTAEVGAKK